MSTVRHRRLEHGQNFLRSGRLVDRLLARSGIGPDDLVVEIGPGTGVITERLAPRCRQVLAIEQDPRLVELLRGRFAGIPNVAVFAADFLGFPLPITGYKVFANIPFNITTAIVTRLTTEPGAPDDAHLVVQREAASKLLGEPRESLSGLLLKPWFEPTLVHRFARHDFVPAPGVEVVLLRLRKRGPPLIDPRDAGLYRDLVVRIFTAWQPTRWRGSSLAGCCPNSNDTPHSTSAAPRRRFTSRRGSTCSPRSRRSPTSRRDEPSMARKHASAANRTAWRRCIAHEFPGGLGDPPGSDDNWRATADRSGRAAPPLHQSAMPNVSGRVGSAASLRRIGVQGGSKRPWTSPGCFVDVATS